MHWKHFDAFCSKSGKSGKSSKTGKCSKTGSPGVQESRSPAVQRSPAQSTAIYSSKTRRRPRDVSALAFSTAFWAFSGFSAMTSTSTAVGADGVVGTDGNLVVAGFRAFLAAEMSDAVDISSADGYWLDSNAKTRNYPVVRAKTSYHCLGGRQLGDSPGSITQGYMGFVRFRVANSKNSPSILLVNENYEQVIISLPNVPDLYASSRNAKRAFPLLLEGGAEEGRRLLGLYSIATFTREEGATNQATVRLSKVAPWWEGGLESQLAAAPKPKRYRVGGPDAEDAPVPLAIFGRGSEAMELFLHTIERAQSNLRVSIFLLDSPKFESAISRAAQRGCRVRVMINGASPNVMHALPRVSAAWAEGNVVEVKEISDIAADDPAVTPILHAKLVVADSHVFDEGDEKYTARGCFAMGSPNPTRAGAFYNLECSMRTIGHSVEAANLAWQFDAYWRGALEV